MHQSLHVTDHLQCDTGWISLGEDFDARKLAQLSDLDRLLELANEMERAGNCGLGQTAAVPTRDILKHFRAEVEAHIRLGVCPSGVCPMTAQTV